MSLIIDFSSPSLDSPCSSLPEPLKANARLMRLYETLGIEKTDDQGNSMLHIAASEGCEEWVQYLIDQGADPLKVNAMGDTALHVAVRKNSYSLVSLLADSLLARGSNLNIPNNKKYMPLHLAARQNATEAVRALIEKGADKEGGAETGMTPLWVAIIYQRPEIVLQLIDAGASISLAQSSSFYLQQAVLAGSLEVVRALLIRGAPVDSDSRGVSPVCLAIEEGKWRILQLLCDTYPHLAQTILPNGSTPLHNACMHNQLHCVRVLLPYNPSLAVFQDKKGRTPLHDAARDPQKAPILQALIDGIPKPCVLDIFDEDQMTPLMIATSSSSCVLVGILLEGGADMYKTFNKRSASAIYSAILKNNPRLLEVFLRADPDLCNPSKKLGSELEGLAEEIYCTGAAELMPYAQFTVGILYRIALYELSLISGLQRSQFFDLDGVQFDYYTAPPFYRSVAESLPEEYSTLQKAFLEASTIIPEMNRMIESYRRGELIVIPSGWSTHEVCIVMQKNIMILCNRGRLAGDVAFRAYQINPRNFTEQVLEEISNFSCLEQSAGYKYLYETLPNSLAKDMVEDPAIKRFCNSLPSISNKKQKWGNCTSASVKAAMRASIALSLFTSDPDLFGPEVLYFAKEVSKEVTASMRYKAELKFSELMPYLPERAADIKKEFTRSIAKRGVRELKEANKDFELYLRDHPLRLEPITTALESTDF